MSPKSKVSGWVKGLGANVDTHPKTKAFMNPPFTKYERVNMITTTMCTESGTAMKDLMNGAVLVGHPMDEKHKTPMFQLAVGSMCIQEL